MTVFVQNYFQIKRKTNWANDEPQRVIPTKFNQFKYIFHHEMIGAQDFFGLKSLWHFSVAVAENQFYEV